MILYPCIKENDVVSKDLDVNQWNLHRSDLYFVEYIHVNTSSQKIVNGLRFDLSQKL